MTVEKMSDYDELTSFLAEYKLTSREYKTRFETAMKQPDETYILFAATARLRTLLYLNSRDVADFGLGLEEQVLGLGFGLGLACQFLVYTAAQSHNRIETNPEQTIRSNYRHAFDFVNKVESIVCCAYFRQIKFFPVVEANLI